MTEYRILPEQRRNLLITTVVFFAVAVVAGGIAAAANVSGLWFLCIICGPCSVIFLLFYWDYSAVYTRFNSKGISGRGLGLGSRFEYRWEQISNITLQSVSSGRSSSTVMVLTTVHGRQIRTAVPISGGVMDDPGIKARYEHIRAAWQIATGRTAHEERLKIRWWVFPFALAFVIQVILAVVLVGMETGGGAQGAPVPGVLFLVLLALDVGCPLYSGHRRRRRARKERDRMGLPGL